MHLVTLTSDWNESDYYIGAIKGQILSICPDANIQDLNHQIKPFNTSQAAFVVRNCYPNFPEGTVHIIAVNTEPEKDSLLIAAKIDGHYFLCADNGIIGLIAKDKPQEVISLNKQSDDKPGSFVALSVFTEAACAILKGKKLEELGTRLTDYVSQVPLRATIEKNTVAGSVIYIDSYANAITNISKELFERIGEGKKFEILVQSRHYTIDKINNSYSDTPPGDLLALFNSVGLLEIAIRNGNAAKLLKLNTNSTIRIEFNEKE
jgi:S-adenosylmethionine hydrolase